MPILTFVACLHEDGTKSQLAMYTTNIQNLLNFHATIFLQYLRACLVLMTKIVLNLLFCVYIHPGLISSRPQHSRFGTENGLTSDWPEQFSSRSRVNVYYGFPVVLVSCKHLLWVSGGVLYTV